MTAGDLHRPDGRLRAAAVVVHPHPTMGGDRHHPLAVAVAERLAGQGVAALRPDLRDPDPARSAWALGLLAEGLLGEVGADRLVLVGYSWGSVVCSLARLPELVGRVLVAPPVALVELGGADDTPALVLVPAHDQYGGPAAVEATLGSRSASTVEVVPGADHFLAGAVDAVARRAVDWVAGLLPGSADGAA
jgi:alpha/beta superfamily hydrolase